MLVAITFVISHVHLLLSKFCNEPHALYTRTIIVSVWFSYTRYTVLDTNGKPQVKTSDTKNPEIQIKNLTPFTSYQFYVKRKIDTSFPTEATLDAKTLEAGWYRFCDSSSIFSLQITARW